MSPGKVLVAACVSVALAGGVLLAQNVAGPKPSKLPVTIEIAGMRPDVVPLVTEGAWPLTIRAVAHKFQGIGTYDRPYQFPLAPQQAFIVISDPDACFSLSRDHDTALWGAQAACPGGADEVYVEFTPTINMVNLLKGQIDTVYPSRLGAAPRLHAWTQSSGNNELPSVGPSVGNNESDGAPCGSSDPYGVCDNYGYGASPNMPGLVILSDAGVGLVWDSDFQLAQPRTARNLAGFINSVDWTLNDCEGPNGCATGRSGVTAHMNVPRRLFSPVARLDLGKGSGTETTGRWYQIDGGAWVPDNSYTLLTALNSRVTTVRVFVVSGHGPAELADEDGDGIVDSRDAVRAGYKLLSDEAVFQIRTYHQSVTIKGSDLAVLYDKDGNGMDGDGAPAGGGGITGIPR